MQLQACGTRVELVEVLLPTLAAEACAPVEVLLEGRRLTARVRTLGETLEAHLEAYGAFRCPPGNAPLEILRWPADDALRTAFLHGPVLLSALAREGIHALHASALRLGSADAPAIALTADSGTGKSTLARAALARGWECLADDVLPLAPAPGGGIDCLPHFRQLKLAESDQYPSGRPARVPLAALVRLGRGPAANLQPLPAREAMQIVLSATIASRLYPPAVLAQHLRFAAELASSIGERLQAWSLTVPDEPAAADAHAQAALDTLRSAIIGAG